jgi:hypothetical protein
MTLEQLISQLEDLIDSLPEDAKPFKTLFKSRLGAGLTLEDWNGLNTQLKDILAVTTKPSDYETLVEIMKNIVEKISELQEDIENVVNINIIQTNDIATNNSGILNLQNIKVDKVQGKDLSTVDYTTDLNNKLNEIETGAQVNKLENIDITGYGTTPGTPISINIVDKKATINLNQKADLIGGKIPADQLPASVDQVLEFATLSAFPVEGVSSRLYVALDTNRTYRWGSTQYVEISESLALGETPQTAHRGDHGKAAYDHSLIAGLNPHGTNINQLQGVNLISPQNGQVLKFNGSVWVNQQDIDTDRYLSGVNFNTTTGQLTLTGAGGQATLNQNLDGRYYLSTNGRIVWSSIDLPTNLVDYGLSDLVATKNHLHDERYPVLAGGKIPDSYLPPLAITTTHVVNSQAAQDVLTVQEGDVAIRTDLNKSFIYTGTTWQELLTPTDVVLSVNNKTGVITLTPTDIGSPSTSQFNTLNNTVSTFINTTYTTDKGVIESDITALEGRATALETDSHTHTNKSTLDGIVGVQTSISSQSSTENNQLATIGAIKNYVGNPDSTWQGQANFLRDVNGDYYPSVPNTPDTVVIRDENGKVNIGYDNADSTIVATTYKGAIDELDLRKADVSLLNSNINLYPTDAPADVTNYFKMVTTFEDPDYDTTAVNIPTGLITTTAQLLASLIAPAGLFVGNPGIVNIVTLGNIRKTAGNANAFAEFYFQVYQRASNGTETLIATSDTTGAVNPSNGNYREFNASAVLNNGTFLPTDRIVIKYYANSIGPGAEYDFQFGGTQPVRTLIPVPVSVIPSDVASDIIVDASGFEGILSEDDVNVQHALETLDAHDHDGVYQPVGDYATNTYVNGLLAGADAMIFKGTIGTGGTVTALPTAYNAGWTFKVITAGTYAAKNCEVGDMLLATVDRTEGQGVNGDWAVIQTNIDGAVTGPVSSTDNHVAIFDGTTGKIIKNSGTLISELSTTTHTHGSITSDGKIGTSANLAVVTGTGGVLTTRQIADSTASQSLGTGNINLVTERDVAFGLALINNFSQNRSQVYYAPSTTGTSGQFVKSAGTTVPSWANITVADVTNLQTSLDAKVTANANITGATNTKITYDAKGLVTAGGSLAESDIPMIPISKVTNLQTNLSTLEIYINNKAENYVPIISIASNRTFNNDGNRVFSCTNSSAITLTIPTDATYNHPIATQIAVIRNGAGTITFSPASGVTLNSDTNKRAIKGQFNSAALLKIAANTWSLVGSLE